jgi:DNA invertase Pin-like site-specific DNA recombinase
MLGIFAEFERSIIAERVRAGLARARAEGADRGAALDKPGGGRRAFARSLRGLASIRAPPRRCSNCPFAGASVAA